MAMDRDLVKKVRFNNPRLSVVGVDVLDWQTLHRRAGLAPGTPERVDFYLLMLVHRGRVRHRVDFVDHELRPGQVMLVRPGQVQQWQFNQRLAADLVLVVPAALAPSVAHANSDMRLVSLEDWPTVMQPSPAVFAEAQQAVARLRLDITQFTGDSFERAIVRHGLAALLLRLARASHVTQPARAPSRDLEIHRMFQRELERNAEKRLSVDALAQRIGYSESTITRACWVATGHTAKQLLDLRTVLEAKRLLVHSNASVAEIGARLRFSEPTNFVKFFKRLEGQTPMEFREANVVVGT